jgi:putative zinc finger/helix-turn-helix YgiT family protein
MNRDHRPIQEYGPRCGCCQTGHLVTQFRKERFEYESETGPITVDADRVPVDVCDTCHSVFVTAQTAKTRHEYVCRALGLITPAEIKEIRERHGLSQAEFARITKLGESSISRWERGRLLPSPSNSTFLKLLQRRPEAVDELLDGSVADPDGEAVSSIQDPAPRQSRFPSVPSDAWTWVSTRAARFALVGTA